MQTVTPTEARELVRGGALLLDVRGGDEWDAGRSPDATHIPLGELDARHGELDKARIVLTICRSGARSAQAQSSLVSAGFDARNVSGGMQAWERAGLPVTRQGDGHAEVI